jgi:hypothetical protein
MNNTPLLSLSALLAASAAIVVDDHYLTPKKKRDGKDHPIGILSDDMKQLWLLRAERRETVDDIVDRIEDLITVHRADHTEHGETVPREIETKFHQDLTALTDELKGPYREFCSADRVFQAGVTLAYRNEAPEGKDTVGIREGYQIIVRSDNARGDEDDPVSKLKSHTTRTRIFEVIFAVPTEPETPAEPASPSPAG